MMCVFCDGLCGCMVCVRFVIVISNLFCCVYLCEFVSVVYCGWSLWGEGGGCVGPSRCVVVWWAVECLWVFLCILL